MFDLRLVLEDGPFGGLWGWVEYNTDLFEAAHVKQLVGHFLTVTEAAAASPTPAPSTHRPRAANRRVPDLEGARVALTLRGSEGFPANDLTAWPWRSGRRIKSST